MENQQPTVEQRAQRPPGNVPKNRSTWVMVGAAVLLILAILFSGNTQPKQRTINNPIADIKTTSKDTLDNFDKTVREAEAAAALARDKAARSRTNFEELNRTEGIPGQAVEYNGQRYYPVNTAPAQPVDPLEAERKKREYQSLFASNVALSLRDKEQTTGAAAQPVKTAAAPPQTSAADPAQPEKSGYKLFEGTIIETVLTNRLEGSFAGPVNVMVTTDVYSFDRQALLIPKGSRILGEASRVTDRDQQRLAVVFHRVIMPDGYSVDLDKISGLDQAGDSALKDKVNHHYLATFGTSVALGLISGFSLYGTNGGYTMDGADAYRQGVSRQLGLDSMHILDRRLNRVPDITIREGHRVKILLNSDLLLPAYDQHSKE